MTTEEKLKHFQDICMEDARDRSAKMLDDYMNALEKMPLRSIRLGGEKAGRHAGGGRDREAGT